MNTLPRRAVVIGASMAGLCAARALLDHFDQITLIERDVPPHARDFRKGVPQARHPHALLKGGEQVLEGYFPGLKEELKAKGAHILNMGEDVDWNMFGIWRRTYRSALDTISCSRPLLEATVYERLMALPGITVLHQREVVGLRTNGAGTQVTGVHVRTRGQSAEITLDAELVVDTSGRHSDAPKWLKAMGYPVPEETVVSAQPGYASRIYELTEAQAASFRAAYIQPCAPETTRGGLMLPMEGGRVHVTLIGMAGDHPPTQEEGFNSFARSLCSNRVWDFIRTARPLTDIWGFRGADNRLRSYHRLDRHLEGLLVMGDAVFAPNPVYGQGMTIAALGSRALGACVAEQRARRPLAGMVGVARHFQRALYKVVEGPWQIATGEDRRWPIGGSLPKADLPTRLLQVYVGRLLRVSMTRPDVADAFFRVQQMIEAPPALLRPSLLWAALTGQQRPAALAEGEPTPTAELTALSAAAGR